MHRIDGPGHVNNLFQMGNPQTGVRATMVTSDWLNDVQENLSQLVEYAGFGLTKGDGTQLTDAVVKLIGDAIATIPSGGGGGGGGGSGGVPLTRQVNGGGLVTGGGALAADLVLSVTAATQAEVAAGIANDRAITPYVLAQALGANRNANYLPLPGGVLMQWGSLISGLTEGGVLITLPTSFSDPDYAVVTNGINQGGAINVNSWTQRGTKSAGSFTAFVQSEGATAQLGGIEWFAIGRYN